jgi:hypothetical protein
MSERESDDQGGVESSVQQDATVPRKQVATVDLGRSGTRARSNHRRIG